MNHICYRSAYLVLGSIRRQAARRVEVGGRELLVAAALILLAVNVLPRSRRGASSMAAKAASSPLREK